MNASAGALPENVIVGGAGPVNRAQQRRVATIDRAAIADQAVFDGNAIQQSLKLGEIGCLNSLELLHSLLSGKSGRAFLQKSLHCFGMVFRGYRQGFIGDACVPSPRWRPA